jgi:hypothetical protein
MDAVGADTRGLADAGGPTDGSGGRAETPTFVIDGGSDVTVADAGAEAGIPDGPWRLDSDPSEGGGALLPDSGSTSGSDAGAPDDRGIASTGGGGAGGASGAGGESGLAGVTGTITDPRLTGGGCGCRIGARAHAAGGESAEQGAAIRVLVLLGALALRRRRRKL